MQRAVIAALREYGFRSTPDIIRDIYDLHAHGTEIEPAPYSKAQYDAVARAINRLGQLRHIRLSNRVNVRGEQSWELIKLKSEPARSASWRAKQTRALGLRLAASRRETRPA